MNCVLAVRVEYNFLRATFPVRLAGPCVPWEVSLEGSEDVSRPAEPNEIHQHRFKLCVSLRFQETRRTTNSSCSHARSISSLIKISFVGSWTFLARNCRCPFGPSKFQHCSPHEWMVQLARGVESGAMRHQAPCLPAILAPEWTHQEKCASRKKTKEPGSDRDSRA